MNRFPGSFHLDSGIAVIIQLRMGWRIVSEPFPHDSHGHRYVMCVCDCGLQGRVRVRSGGKLRTLMCRACSNRAQSFRHGMTAVNKPRPPEYQAWANMMNRCYSPTSNRFQTYGARGIRVCERWHDAVNFVADMGQRPSPKHSLDRINNDGDYEPDNCRWALTADQLRNKTNTTFLTYNGVTLSMSEWRERTGLKRLTILGRLEYGWSHGQALGFDPPPPHKKWRRAPATPVLRRGDLQLDRSRNQ